MKANSKKTLSFTGVFCILLAAAFLVFAAAVAVTAYLSGSDLISDPALCRGLSAYFEKSARFITKEDLATVRALKLEYASVSVGGEEILAGVKKNHALTVTDTESLIDLNPYFHEITFSEPIYDFGVVELFENLEYLSVYESPALLSLDQVKCFENLYELEIWSEGAEIESLSALSELENLRVLTVANASLADLSALEGMDEMLRLNFSGNEISDLSPISGMKELRVLSLPQNNVRTLEPLAALSKLEYLDLSDNEVTDLSPVQGLSELRQLTLSNSQENTEDTVQNNVSDLGPVGALEKLEFLYVNHNPVYEADALTGLEKLSAASFDGCKLTSVAPFEKMEGLYYLSLKDNDLKDVSPLAGCEGLRYLYLEGNDEIEDLSALSDKEDLEVDLLAEQMGS